MPQSIKSKRGGARKGAGRKTKALIEQASKAEVSRAAMATVGRFKPPPAAKVPRPASDIAPAAYAALQDVVTDRNVPASARVAAARAILDLARAEQASDSAEAPTGKKAQAAQAAQNVVTTPNDEWGTDLMLQN